MVFYVQIWNILNFCMNNIIWIWCFKIFAGEENEDYKRCDRLEV